MVVEPNRKEVTEPPKSNKALAISVALHVVILLLVIFGLPHFQSEPELAEPVPIELVSNIGELTTTNKPPVEAPKPKEEKPPEPPQKTEEQKKPPVPKKAEPEPPPEETLKEPPKEEPKKVEKLDEKAEKKVEKKPEPKKEKPKPKPTETNDMDQLLKDLTTPEKEQPKTDQVAPKMTEPTPSPNVSRFSNVLSMSEMDALRQQLSQCWSIMAGGKDADSLIVEVAVTVNQDMTVANAEVVDRGRYGSDTAFRAAADSAMRALRKAECTPLRLPPDKYDQWHQMRIVFDPKEMF